MICETVLHTEGTGNHLMAECVNALKEWTGKNTATTVYDSTIDEFTDQGLFNKVMGKPNIALVGFTADGDVFGWFYNVAVTRQEKWFDDPNIFAFSFESHGRCMTPQRFVVKAGKDVSPGVFFEKDHPCGFLDFSARGPGVFCLGDECSDSYCRDLSNVFEGLEDSTLSGRNCSC